VVSPGGVGGAVAGLVSWTFCLGPMRLTRPRLIRSAVAEAEGLDQLLMPREVLTAVLVKIQLLP
jgi:hypothetical protein